MPKVIGEKDRYHCIIFSFSFFFSRGDEVLVNREVGHLMRTKSTAHQDGGVSSGRANLDSPYLV